jgi:DNA-binding transcriptional LysR family regulator
VVASIPLIQNDERGVQGVQNPDSRARELLAGVSWDDLKLFLQVSDGGSLRSAAQRSGVAVNTVRAKLERLEQQLGEPLVSRSHHGIKLTASGLRLRKLALSMNSASVPSDDVLNVGQYQPQELTIIATEALGSGWLTPRLLDLQQQFPSLTMTMICDNDLDADRSTSCDIQVGWKVPRNPDLIVSKLATVHFMPFASRDYLRRFGTPKTADELLQHRFIEQVSPGVKSDLLNQLVGSERPAGFLPIRTNSSFCLFWAVANSAGIAYMPTYTAALADMLEPIDLPFLLRFEIYYCYRIELRSSEIVMAGIEWLKQCFSPELYPWFRSEFVHPREFFPKASGKVVPLFETFGPATSRSHSSI